MNLPPNSAVQGVAQRTGYVAIVGRPNVGKSTLLNGLVGQRISITSRKPQTTRHRILGVRTEPTAQWVFVDTPGYQLTHKSVLTRRMNKAVTGALTSVDAIVFVIEASGWRTADRTVLQLLPKGAQRVVLALNKIDLIADKERLLPLIAESMQHFPFCAVVPVSAEKNRQLDNLLAEIKPLLPEGLPLFEADQVTDRSVRFLAAELVREAALSMMREEVPHGIACVVERFEEPTKSKKKTEISVAIHVARESHKKIVVGRAGAMIKEIGQAARLRIEELLGQPVHLETHVRVTPEWFDKERDLRELGYGKSEVDA
jgi:GTP-binding protein Era